MKRHSAIVLGIFVAAEVTLTSLTVRWPLWVKPRRLHSTQVCLLGNRPQTSIQRVLSGSVAICSHHLTVTILDDFSCYIVQWENDSLDHFLTRFTLEAVRHHEGRRCHQYA